MITDPSSAPRRRIAFVLAFLLFASACGSATSSSSSADTTGPTSTLAVDAEVPQTTNDVPSTIVEVPQPAAPKKISYGPGEFQYGILHLPATPTEQPPPVAMLIHGGFWTNSFGFDLMDFQAADLTERGWAVWNIEYRRVGDPDGGGENTMADVAEALRALETIAEDEPLNLDEVVVIGHSSGGHLALWVNGVADVVQPALAIGQAAVVNVYNAAADNLGGGATQAFLGGQASEVPDAYEFANPIVRGQVVLVHGVDDRIVPLDQVDGLRGNAQVEVAEVPGGHFEHLDPSSEAWAQVLKALDDYGLAP